MNSRHYEYCQQSVDSDDGDLSVTSMDDWSDIVSNVAPARPVSAIAEDALAEIDAIPVTAELMLTLETPKEVVRAAIAAEDEAKLDAVLATLDLSGTPDQPRRHRELSKLYNDTYRADIEHHRRTGHIKQGLDAIDEWRTTPEGKEHRKLTRKEKRHLKALEEGRVIKPRRSGLTDEQRKRSEADRQAKHRTTIPVADQSAGRQERRENAKQRDKDADAAKLQAIKDNPTF
ncbi:hypothetical protein [Ensifer canadensis]